jgi:hypothetical protein
MESVGRLLVTIAVLLGLFGGALIVLGRLGFSGFPGDILVRGKHLTFYFPLGLSIALSLILTLLANFWLRR